MKDINAVAEANNALRDIWEAGRKPSVVVLRSTLLQHPAEAPLLTRLVRPKGVALRFYLLAIFEAHARLEVDTPWSNALPLSGTGSWSDLVAIDGAYDTRSGQYMPGTRQGRDLERLRLRQVHGALNTLEGLGREKALVGVPRNGSRRRFEAFSLMQETGRGDKQTPNRYTVPVNHWSATTIAIPPDFFLKGWIQVLNPSEIATWLILRGLSQWARNAHTDEGVYLYGETRMADFGLKRDAWEDGCQRLREFGLIRTARAPQAEGEAFTPATPIIVDFQTVLDRARTDRYEPQRWQMRDEGLAEEGITTCLKELTLRQKDLEES